MSSKTEWVESKAKERTSQNFLKTVLELSGYKVMNFGVENHNQEIIGEIKTNYASPTNRRLMSMPDFVVIDEETKEAQLVEVKHRTFEQPFDIKNTDIAFKYGSIKTYLDFWKETTLIITLNVSPYCLCIDVDKINWNVHFKKKFENNRGNFDELWNFSGIYQVINNKFSKVTPENFKKAQHLLGS